MTFTICTPWLDSRELIPDYVAAVNVSGAERVLIIDTGSQPPLRSGEFKGKPRFYTVCEAATAKGFSSGCNLGLQLAETDAVLFLNNDVVHLADDWLAPIKALLRPGRLVGPTLITADHTRVDGRLFPYLEGWCVAGLRQDLLDLGGWDETLDEPAYWSDNLLCLKARQEGFRLVQMDVPLRHIGNATSGKDVERREAASAVNHERFIDAARAVMAETVHA